MDLLKRCRGLSSKSVDIESTAPPPESKENIEAREKAFNRSGSNISNGSKESTPMPVVRHKEGSLELDCYPYTFSPLLLFAQDYYFDKGHSNYNAVAQFFSPALDVNMLENVLFERKNMRYEELLQHVSTTPGMIVTCCIDSHFTAFQVLGNNTLIYYDPLKPGLSYVSGESSYNKLVCFLLLKCAYGDSQHIQEDKEHYTGRGSNSTRRLIYSLWRDINKLEADRLYDVKTKQVSLNLQDYMLINNARDSRMMSTQETGNTCYFQTYLFAVLCKVCSPSIARDGASLDLRNLDHLAKVTIDICRFLLEFFVQEEAEKVMRPLTNNNFVLDFHRFEEARYYDVITRYLRHRQVRLPDYELQYKQVLQYYLTTKTLHKYGKFQLSGEMPSTLNTKSLQAVVGTDDGRHKLGMSNYYKYRAANMMFGFNTGITRTLRSFCEFNALRKNQLLAFYQELSALVGRRYTPANSKYRDYYFMPQFEIGQRELVDLHHFTYEIDIFAMLGRNGGDRALTERIHSVNSFLLEKAQLHFSTQNLSNYDKILPMPKFVNSREHDVYLNQFMTIGFFNTFAGLGFSDINPKEKEVNSLTQTVFYSCEMMLRQASRMEYEFEKECINQMARSTLRKHLGAFEGRQQMNQKYNVCVKIGYGFTYSKYNTLMHFLNVVQCYWHNPDINAIQVFGKDIRTLLTVSCQKVFFEEGHSYYHYGPLETGQHELDLQVASSNGEVAPFVSTEKRGGRHTLVVTDRVYEYDYLREILDSMFRNARGVRIKTDNEVLNLSLLSLLLDFGLYEEHAGLLNLPFMNSLKHGGDKLQLQVEVSNLINEFDKNNTDSVTRLKVEELIFEASYKFLVNKNFSVHSKEFELIRQLSADPVYHRYLLLCKLYVSLCQINKSVEVDYYKIRCNNDFRIIIPQNYSRATSDYLEQITKQYTFAEQGGFILYDELRLFDVSASQPEIHLYKVRFDSATPAQSMVKYIEISNVFRASEQQYVIFIAGNTLLVEVAGGAATVHINEITVEIATIFFNEAISFIPCFKYADSEDVILFTSRNIHYLVDKGGQYNENYYGMKHELMECINSEQIFVDLNDEHVFKKFKLCELLTESKTVIYFPDYLLQVQSRQQLINLLDFAIYIRNVSFFILVLIYLRRASVALEFVEKDKTTTKITGPWRESILYVLNRAPNKHYDAIFEKQFFDVNQHQNLPLSEFVDVMCTHFTRYQRFTDGQYQIVPTEKQKQFLQRIIRAEECFHFSEVGSGKTKVILPLLCQTFLSNNVEAHGHLARGGRQKQVLVILVPEHLVHDAQAQVYRYCLNLNFREEYRIYDDIFALLHDAVQLGEPPANKRARSGSIRTQQPSIKQIFITSFNQFKKALTYDEICAKVFPNREHILVLLDEVDDFLDRDKLVFNICSNKNNDFKKPVLERYFEASRAVYRGETCPLVAEADNPAYWQQLHDKFAAVHTEIQEKSRSINKSFGIFNEQTLRHCSSNVAFDIEGYKSLIARPYESVNRAMPGSYYTDVERTIYLTYYVLMEDIAKYDNLFQEERKFISFEYFTVYLKHLDYDDLVYGHTPLSALVVQHPGIKDGLARFLYEIILRRMEIQDKSRSVNSVDIVFNFDCIGFTGTPFIDNYPTFAYIRSQREDTIPDLIDRSFYVYGNESLSDAQFEERFARFQGTNSNVLVEYVPSDFLQGAADELAILSQIFAQQQPDTVEANGFNVLVDLCGIFKKTTITEVRNLVLRHFGPDRFRYIYHIDQTDGSDRVLYLNSDNDVQFDEEFYKNLCKSYGESLREKVFFFIDNRNVIGKDIPFQLIYQRTFSQPLFYRSVVLAHDVDDFSKIWQAMGRSRTMNDTRFAIYKSGMAASGYSREGGVRDIKKFPLTRELYVRNCNSKMAGNLSSIYQTLISLFNLSQSKFYYCNEIVNVFLEKMEMTIVDKVRCHEENIARRVLGAAMPSAILMHILTGKFQKSARLAAQPVTPTVVSSLLRQVIEQQFEQRVSTGDVYDELVSFLSDDRQGAHEVSYTKQQQKQKQKQNNKNQDTDIMEMFNKKNQWHMTKDIDNYFQYTLNPQADMVKISFNLPISVPIFKLAYALDGQRRYINIYPTLQFLYSHHIQAEYIDTEVKDILDRPADARFFSNFMDSAQRIRNADQQESDVGRMQQLDVQVLKNHVRQNPQYTLAALSEGIYMLGMKDQFNIHDLRSHPMQDDIRYVADDMGFILMDRSAGSGDRASSMSMDTFGPYFIEQYIIMEALSKQEVAQTVMDHYVHHKPQLQSFLTKYKEKQGMGFICWRFINERHEGSSMNVMD